MICAYCQQDVNEPCHNVQEMQQRAESHIERCEHAYRSQAGRSHPMQAPPNDSPNGGRGD